LEKAKAERKLLNRESGIIVRKVEYVNQTGKLDNNSLLAFADLFHDIPPYETDNVEVSQVKLAQPIRLLDKKLIKKSLKFSVDDKLKQSREKLN